MPTDPNENMAVSLALAGLAFVVTIILGRPIINFLIHHRMGKSLRMEGPETHISKIGHADDGRSDDCGVRWS